MQGPIRRTRGAKECVKFFVPGFVGAKDMANGRDREQHGRR